MSRRVRVLAPAKVNLTLEILGERDDGYHELASVMATVDLTDDVRVGPSRTLDVRISPDVGAAAGDDLASRAVRAFADACGREPLAHVNVRKRIPVSAGLGGGSSDAGAVLRALADIWRCEVDVTALAAFVGSDVPFFASGHPVARISGRGESVSALPAPPDPIWIVLVTLPARASTRDVFAALGGARGDGRATEELARLLASGGATPTAIRALARNDLTAAAERICSLVADARRAGAARGIDLVVSGSGTALFAIADDRAHAIRMSRSLRRAQLRARPHVIAIGTHLLRDQ